VTRPELGLGPGAFRKGARSGSATLTTRCSRFATRPGGWTGVVKPRHRNTDKPSGIVAQTTHLARNPLPTSKRPGSPDLGSQPDRSGKLTSTRRVITTPPAK